MQGRGREYGMMNGTHTYTLGVVCILREDSNRGWGWGWG